MSPTTKLDDRFEIVELFNRYADALDHRRWSDLPDLFTEDVTTEWFGVHRVDGRDNVVAFISDLVGKVARTHHILGNHRVDVDGDTATASARVRAYHVGAGDRAHLFEESLAGFETRVVRTGTGWRFSHFAEPLYVMLGTQEVFGLPDPDQATGAVPARSDADVVRALLDAESRRDIAAMTELVAPDLVFDTPYAPPGVPATLTGRDAFGDTLRRFIGVDGGFYRTFELDDIVVHPTAEPGLVFAEYASTGVVAATGHTYTNRYVALFRLVDGKVQLFREYFNPLPLQAALAPAG
ncbi:hypothetical protein GCM10027290_64420 [Micromonospora sonneratiae]|uniref:Nuclear transport factor 2 family protein n=1 Tax=Micromonospora sonneratiae TaxID=1184706 RepID=A0ABW3YES4_9ACTN